MKAPAERCYNSWRGFKDVQQHFDFIESMEKSEETHWICRYRGIFTTSDAQVQLTEDVPDRVIAWKTSNAPAAQGSVVFNASGADTFMTFVLSYDPPGGRAGDMMSRLWRFPRRGIEQGLEAWVRAMEKL